MSLRRKKMGILSEIVFKLSLHRPVVKRELLDYRYEVSEMVKAVQEIEAINRNDVATILEKVNKIYVGQKIKDIKDIKNKHTKDGVEYQ